MSQSCKAKRITSKENNIITVIPESERLRICGNPYSN